MTAIWPAGPPKQSTATRSQTRNASAKVTAVRGAGLGGRERIVVLGHRHAPGLLPTASCGSRRWRRGTSDRTRRRAACRPRAARDRRHTCATGRARRRAGPAPPARDRGGAVSAPRTIVARRWSGSVREPELLDHDVEGAGLAAMAPEHALDVERRGAEALGDAVDLRPARRTGTPRADRRSGGSARGRRCGRSSAARASPRRCGPARRAAAACRRDQRQAGLAPGLEAALQAVGRHAGVPQPGGDALAELDALLADRRWRSGRRIRAPSPARRRGGGAASRESGADRRRSPPRCARR